MEQSKPFAEEILSPAGPERAPIGQEEIRQAAGILREYRRGKANLERRIIDNEQWWKMRHWSRIPHGGDGDPRPASGWLVNVCLSKHADAMDAYPEGPVPSPGARRPGPRPGSSPTSSPWSSTSAATKRPTPTPGGTSSSTAPAAPACSGTRAFFPASATSPSGGSTS